MKQLSNVLTPKGLLKTKVSHEIKEQAIAKLIDMGFEVMPNGRLAMQVAEADGKVVTINLDVAVGLDTNFEKKVKVVKEKVSEPVDVPNLFD